MRNQCDDHENAPLTEKLTETAADNPAPSAPAMGGTASESSDVLQFGRRSFMAAAAAAMTGSVALGRDYGPHAQPVRYPEPDVAVLDKRFAPYKLPNSPIQRL